MASTLQSGATILDVIGSTPLLDVDGIWLKLEYLNPSGSIKARMACSTRATRSWRPRAATPATP
jgi:hypothetical protein